MKRTLVAAAMLAAIVTPAHADWQTTDGPDMQPGKTICRLTTYLPQSPNSQYVPPSIVLSVSNNAFLIQAFGPGIYFGPKNQPVNASFYFDDQPRVYGQGVVTYVTDGLVNFPMEPKVVNSWLDGFFDYKTFTVEFANGAKWTVPTPGVDKESTQRLHDFVDCANRQGGITHVYGRGSRTFGRNVTPTPSLSDGIGTMLLYHIKCEKVPEHFLKEIGDHLNTGKVKKEDIELGVAKATGEYVTAGHSEFCGLFKRALENK